MKYLSIIGSTGSIGTQTLDVVSQHPDQFKVVALVAHHNIDLLEKQIKEYQPLVAGLVDESAFKELQGRYTGPTKLVGGKEALIAAATIQELLWLSLLLLVLQVLSQRWRLLKRVKQLALLIRKPLLLVVR